MPTTKPVRKGFYRITNINFRVKGVENPIASIDGYEDSQRSQWKLHINGYIHPVKTMAEGKILLAKKVGAVFPLLKKRIEQTQYRMTPSFA